MVNTALFTGLSGLRAHQRYIDVIGNNLANVSTQGFWGSRATFSDILSFTLRPGSGPNGTFGGQNPIQVGLGTTIGSIDADQSQGTFQDTGRALDVAMQGRGFFTLSDGTQSFYTRAGTFGVDKDRKLVDTRTGYRVVSASGGDITLPVTDTQPAKATSTIKFQGNLPATVTGPLQEIVESQSSYYAGTAAAKTGAGPTYNLSSYINKSFLVSVNGGTQTSITLTAGSFANAAAATPAEVANLFNGAFGSTSTPPVVATASGTGVDYRTVKLGDSATLKFDDGTGASGLLSALGLNATLTSGTQSQATAATALNSLVTRTTNYQNGDQITVRGNNADGTLFSDTFVYGTNGTTLGDLVTFINSRVAPAQNTVALSTTSGKLQFSAVNKGAANMSLYIGDATSSTGKSNWPSFSTTQDGKGPDKVTTTIDVIDSLGRTHPVSLEFTRTTTDDNVWDLKASMTSTEGTITSSSVPTIRFNSDGSFNVIGGGTNSLTFQWNGISTAQDVSVDLGSSGKFDGLVLLGSKATAAATDQDGYIAGTLLNTAFDQSGNLLGYYTNGKTSTIDTLRVCVFPNEGGLLREGDTLFVQSPNSDDPIATTAGSAGAGLLRPGSLENSNVDIAKEFVELIEAQRGFQASSRVITTTDEILAELVNIVK